MRKGASLQQLSRMAGAHLDRYPFDVVYVAGGACDITTKSQYSKAISFDWNPPAAVSSHLIRMLDLEDKYLHETYPASRVVFCPLVGTELLRVVTAHQVTPQQQEAVDEAIFKFNSAIFLLNKKRETYSPSLHRTVHRSKAQIKKSYYHHLVDGLHPTESLLQKWADEFVKATKFN